MLAVRLRPVIWTVVNLDVAALRLGFKILEFFIDRKSVIFGVWVAPGALGTLAKGGGRSPPPFGRGSGAPGATQTPKMTDFPSLFFCFRKNCLIKPKCSHAKTAVIAGSNGSAELEPRAPA